MNEGSCSKWSRAKEKKWNKLSAEKVKRWGEKRVEKRRKVLVNRKLKTKIKEEIDEIF